MSTLSIFVFLLIGCSFATAFIPYYYIGPEKITFNEAIRLCETINMRIAGLETKYKYDLLYNWIVASDRTFNNVTESLWISLTRIPDFDSNSWDWYWITGDKLTYVKWLSGEPQNAAGNEQCNIALTCDKSVCIGDVRCSTKYYPLCEKLPEKDCCDNQNNNQGQCPAPTINVSCK